MKKLLLSFILFILVGGAMARDTKRHNVSVLSTKRDLFYFKISKEFVGATLEVVSSQGETILTANVMHHKGLVDFYMKDPGTYTIRLKKNGKEENFTYIKVNPSPLVPMDVDSLKQVITFVN